MNNFEYLQPDSIESASKYVIKNSGAIPYAGGTDVLGMMKDKIIAPSKVVNLKSIKNLSYIKFNEKEGLRIGALTRLNEIVENDIVKKRYRALYESIIELATPQLRNVGTIGGNICQRPRCFYFRGDYNCIRKGGNECFAFTGNNKYHCIIGGDPCYIVHPSDTAVTLLALDTKFKIQKSDSEKTIPASDFFVLPNVDEQNENILQNGEILTEIIVEPKSERSISKYIKVKERGAWDFALVSIAGVFETEGDVIKNGKIVFGGIAPVPWIDKKINENLRGLKINERNF